MKLYSNKEDCCGCGACADICQTGALHMVQDKEGFWYPHIEKELCVKCGRCEKVCPIKDKTQKEYEHQYFGVWAKDEKTRYSSSSGGIFPILAKWILGQGGMVYGAGYNADMRVIHKEVKKEVQLELIKRTKYVQSDMSGIYRRIEKRLKEEKWVLFCGTPCQAHALRLFLGKSYKKLIIIDLICYGVPSPGIWQKYVNYLEHRYGGRMTDFSFRDKRNKDHGRMRSYVVNNVEHVDPHGKDEYCLMYFRNYILRPSCHKCSYCSVDRGSDITIGDFWGIERVNPEMDDGMGTSLVILHTDKGKELWNLVKEHLIKFECRKEEVLQPRLMKPTDCAKGRKWFMLMYRILPFSTIVKIVDDVRSRRILG